MPPVKKILKYLESLGEECSLPILGDGCAPDCKWAPAEVNRILELHRTQCSLANGDELIVAGVDEVGRGPLAGPVAACAVVFRVPLFLPGIGDSKKVPEPLREKLSTIISRKADGCAVAMVEPREIDRINILQGSLTAMARAIENLKVKPDLVLVDGNRKIPGLSIPQRTVIKGDGRIYCIAAASLVAKVARDLLMVEMDEAYPGYGFARHKGYGTREHLDALERLGPCPIHRRSFAPVARFFQGPGSSHSCEGKPGAGNHKDKSLGRKGEEVAAAYLEGRGLKIRQRNFRTRDGEIDLIADDGGTLVFLEVKTRTGDTCGSGLESIDQAKQDQLRRMATLYLARENLVELPVRFDVMTIGRENGRWRARWIKKAF